ncbi:phosphatidylcholine and lysophosphatidylcholine phospholipase [Apophysomyces ossiformis]|uniref:Lysophospholipase NTE1 n=1 Tax=Apophysomyces ossiformis TaxID=679940 RepID=A0A8H7BZ40_9FUNG|nr:phosphatidylcholine and lysophosphatidylcholine phospholipase [Apophysomyces ossiformis]
MSKTSPLMKRILAIFKKTHEKNEEPPYPASLERTYKITNKTLGVGSFAVVKECIHIESGKPFALKIILKKVIAGKEHMLDSELEILKQVRHEHIVSMHDLYESKEAVYIVTDLASGGELFQQLLDKGSYTEKDAANVIRQCLEGLDYLHDHDIVHRDIKPENLLFQTRDADAKLMVTDFGLSKILKHHDDILTTACGTPGYVAPEVLSQTGHGKPVDLWSVGVITFTLLSGYTPFWGEDQTALFEAIMSGKYEYDDEYWSGISETAKDFIDGLLTLDPEQRMTAKQALAHPWITGDQEQSLRTTTNLVPIVRKGFNSRRTLKSLVTAVAILNQWKHLDDLTDIEDSDEEPATAAYLVVRYRFLTKYSRLKPIQPPKVTSSFDLHPDQSEDAGYSKPGFKNYPDEFLSAFLSSIKIFGYLEQPVFHELARHLQTKKLLAGDTLFRNPDQERSFYIVVDGHVQMYVKPENDDENDEDLLNDEQWPEDDERPHENFRNYTLINEVGAGGTLSSLFTILSIFRESFHRSEEREKLRKRTAKMRTSRSAQTSLGPDLAGLASTTGTEMSREASREGWRHVFPNLETQMDGTVSPVVSDELNRRPYGVSASGRTGRRNKTSMQEVTAPEDTELSVKSEGASSDAEYNEVSSERKVPGVSSTMRVPSKPYVMTQQARRQYRSVHPNIVACATVDTTLAVIPEEAFHKLTQKFPKAAAHIVQVIVTRFQRVTLMTSHRYLGLTDELLRLEKLVNESVSVNGLPQDFFVAGGMDRLRRKFSRDDESGTDRSSTTGPAEISRSESSGLIRAIDIMDHPSTPSLHMKGPGAGPMAQSPLSGSVMLSSTPSKNHRQRNSSSVNDEEYSMEDDEHLRASVMRCIAKSVGINIDTNTNDSPSPYTLSPAAQRQHHSSTPETFRSRNYYPMDLFSHAGTVDSSASPLLDPYNVPYDDDVDAISIVSSVQSGSDILSNDHTRSDTISPDDVQILYFPKDAVLVKEGEHTNGLYFVIDGMLEASMMPTDGERFLGDSSPSKEFNGARQEKSRKRMDDMTVETDYGSERGLEFGHKPSSSSSSLSSLTSAAASATATNPSAGKSAATLFTPTMTEKYGEVVASTAPAGRSQASDQNEENERKIKRPLFVIKPGGLAGYLDALTGYPSFVEMRAKTDTYVGFLSKKKLDRLIDRHPTVMLKLAKQLVGILSPLLLHIDLSLEWMQVNAGQIICKEGQPSESIYMVLHGRLRTIRERKEGEIDILGEFGYGDCVGELEVLTGIPTPSTLHAIRNSELARMPKTLFNALALRHPEITLKISRMVAFRSLQLMQKNTPGAMQGGLAGGGSTSIPPIPSFLNSHPELYGRNNVNLKTIGIIPVNASVPLTEFGESLKSALIHSVGATCVLLNSATVTTVMGKHAFSRLGKLKMASWLAEQEEKVRIVLYLADSGVTSQWTRTCIRQADCILLVGLGDGDPSVGEYERFLINMKTTARKELVLLHRERSCASGTTQNWLKDRLWIQAHHHIHMPMKQHATLTSERFRPPWLATQGRKMTSGSINMLSNVKDQLEKYYSAVPTFGRLLVVKKKTAETIGGVPSSPRNDFARLARRLCGKSVALVLGGGGARGVTHIGVIQALEEAGIPIDIIGGTSIGSFVGGLYARNCDLVSTIARSKMFAGRVSSIWRQVMDLTYPVTAWFTGHEFNRAIWKCLGDSQIEDFWLPYFAVTTNITYSRMEVHTTGYAWRYIRASMSLSGYMPPICDNGNMLVDGGYMDNLPVSVAKNMGADIIIAVDVASDDDNSPVYYGDSISGWWALLHSFNPFRTYNIPSIADIQSRLTYVSSVAKLEESKMIDGTLYVKLPVQQWGTLEFNKFNDIMQSGYEVGREVIGRWRKAGYASGRLTNHNGEEIPRGKEVKGKRGRRNSV